MSSEKISPELDYSPVVSNHSTTVYRSVAPQGSNSVTTSITSTVGPTEFVIPPSVMNLSKSRLNFTITVPAQGANNIAHINANLLTAISRITLYDSATNALWCDISNVNQYASLLVPACTDFKDYSTKSFWTANPSETSLANARTKTVEDISKSNLTVGNFGGNGVAASDLALQNFYFSRRQYYNQATAATACYLDVSIPFSAFKMSVLSSDKQLYNPANVVLQIYWNALNNYASVGTAVTNPSTGAGSVDTAFTLSNISLTLANEGNLAIVSQVINKVMTSGISLPIAYPTVTRQSITNATAHSYQLSLTRGYGQRILAIVTAPFSATAGANNANVHIRGTLTTYNTFLNNVPILTPAGFDASLNQDFIIANREYLEGSVIQTNAEYALGEWLHIDGFFGAKPIKDVNQHEIDGLDVGTQSSTWQIQATTSAAADFNWVSLIVGQKVLTVSNMGSMVQ
jgi:hypothetical protein